MKMEMGQLQANTLARIGVLSFTLFLRGPGLPEDKYRSRWKGWVNVALETRGSRSHMRTQCDENVGFGNRPS